ncbi:Alpha-ketoglutarate-dependent dioxygenase alkB [Rhynchospora pubera]|uniref:Alpha-ketoglutarate-dependent dioxygenase alkB n=1 Tax=Rhynchospora pubera TaxID=906938 RepID=A0AAV8HML0_9POAL|nr:Alpha-ketoglutarate-dependent dioxygenase alkB [Rhynchospora pubera]
MAASVYGAETSAATAADLERTAFRRAEKKYKLYKAPLPKSRKKITVTKPTLDLAEVIDFRTEINETLHLQIGVIKVDCPDFDRPVFGLSDHPGFYFIPSALSIEEQCHWIRESLQSFPQPPNRTNLTPFYGPIYDLFDAAKRQEVFSNLENPGNYQGDSQKETMDSCKHPPIPATKLLRKLRWSTLGLQFDWSMRNYNVSLPHNKIPEGLCKLAKKMASPAMSKGEEFRPEAAIVNYYGPSDMLGGHVDDMEADWSRPIVSISLGCKAIFLLGGKTREDAPIAMYVRSGDIVLMAGEARECFHGVPRIFTNEESAEIDSLITQFTSKDEKFILDYIRNSRININIRQVN